MMNKMPSVRALCYSVFAFSLLMIFGTSTAFAQKDSFPKFNAFKVSAEDFELNADHFDPESDAVVLYRKGILSFDIDYGKGIIIATLKVNKRIKILTESGLEEANVQLFYSNNDIDRVSKIKGYTFHLVDGKVEKDKLDKHDIHDEEVSKYYETTSFTLPKVTVGDIIEYEYEIDLDAFITPPTWKFQEDNPVLYSVLEAEIPYGLGFNFQERGWIPMTYRDKSTINTRFGTGDLMEWGKKDLPGLKKEPYISTLDNYYSSISFQLQYVEGAGNIIGTWSQVAEDLLHKGYYGRQLSGKGVLKEAMEKLQTHEIMQSGTVAQKADFLYQFVQKRMDLIKGNYQMYPSDDITEPFLEGKGNSADINFIYIHLLRQAGIDAYPVIISTRDHGIPNIMSPRLADYNSTITAIRDENNEYILTDPSSDHVPLGILPTVDLNASGMMLREMGKQTIMPLTAHTGTIAYNINVNLNNEVPEVTAIKRYSGQTVELVHREYSAKEDNDESKWVKENIFDDEETDLVDYKIDDKKNMFTVSAKANVSDFVEATDGFMYVNPTPITIISENPFSLTERKLPVEFPYPQNYTVSIQMNVPKDYSPEELPQPSKMVTPDQATSFLQIFKFDEATHVLSIQYRIQINSNYILPEKYPDFKNLFSYIEESFNTPVVLVKSETTGK